MQFPHLFPFGRGGPAEDCRRSHVSLPQLFAHYLRLADRRFRGADVVLYLYNYVSRLKMRQSLHVSLKYKLGDVRTATYARLTKDALILAAAHLDNERTALRRGGSLPAPPRTYNSEAGAFC